MDDIGVDGFSQSFFFRYWDCNIDNHRYEAKYDDSQENIIQGNTIYYSSNCECSDKKSSLKCSMKKGKCACGLLRRGLCTDDIHTGSEKDRTG